MYNYIYTPHNFKNSDRQLATGPARIRQLCGTPALTAYHVRQPESLSTHQRVIPASGSSGQTRSSSRTRPEVTLLSPRTSPNSLHIRASAGLRSSGNASDIPNSATARSERTETRSL